MTKKIQRKEAQRFAAKIASQEKKVFGWIRDMIEGSKQIFHAKSLFNLIFNYGQMYPHDDAGVYILKVLLSDKIHELKRKTLLQRERHSKSIHFQIHHFQKN